MHLPSPNPLIPFTPTHLPPTPHPFHPPPLHPFTPTPLTPTPSPPSQNYMAGCASYILQGLSRAYLHITTTTIHHGVSPLLRVTRYAIPLATDRHRVIHTAGLTYCYNKEAHRNQTIRIIKLAGHNISRAQHQPTAVM